LCSTISGNVTWAPLQNMQTKKVSEPTFLHQIKRCFVILFGLRAQVNMAFIFEIAPKSHYLKSWNTNRPRRLYFTIFFNLLFLYFPIFSLNCICCHLFSADNISVFTYNFIHIQFHVIYIKSYILPTNIPAKNLKIV
jgi:hypothetical protein